MCRVDRWVVLADQSCEAVSVGAGLAGGSGANVEQLQSLSYFSGAGYKVDGVGVQSITLPNYGTNFLLGYTALHVLAADVSN